MLRGQTPVVAQRRLRAELRRAREAAGLAQREAAEVLDWSRSKLIRIESGAVGISVRDLRVLLAHYGVSDTDYVEGLVAAVRPPIAWWQFGDEQHQEALRPENEAFTLLQPKEIPGPRSALIEVYPRRRFTRSKMVHATESGEPLPFTQFYMLVFPAVVRKVFDRASSAVTRWLESLRLVETILRELVAVIVRTARWQTPGTQTPLSAAVSRGGPLIPRAPGTTRVPRRFWARCGTGDAVARGSALLV